MKHFPSQQVWGDALVNPGRAGLSWATRNGPGSMSWMLAGLRGWGHKKFNPMHRKMQLYQTCSNSCSETTGFRSLSFYAHASCCVPGPRCKDSALQPKNHVRREIEGSEQHLFLQQGRGAMGFLNSKENNQKTQTRNFFLLTVIPWRALSGQIIFQVGIGQPVWLIKKAY